MELSAVPGPVPYEQSEKAKERKRRYEKTDKGKDRQKKYRHDNSMHQTNAKYLSRKIVFIDSEGITLPDGSHILIRIAITGCKPLVKKTGLHTREILRYIHSHMNVYDLNVIYGGSYDFNMWLKDIPFDHLARLYRGTYFGKGTPVFEFQVKWVPGKMLTITEGKRTITIYDTVHFFQMPFINACDEYLGEYKGREELVREKARRGNFSADELESIGHYNDLEIELGEQLITELRSRLNRVNLRPRRWDGPGAIASALFQREGVKKHKSENNPNPTPEAVAVATRFAYAGGRFEMLKYGISRKNVYEYDINSAYPAALTRVPSLSQGDWIHHSGDIGDLPFALYHVRSRATNPEIPGPVFVRAANGTVSFPLVAENWIWSPEMSVLRKYATADPGHTFDVLEVWEFKSWPGSEKPFAFLNKLYAERQNLKAQGDGAQMALKLAINSAYGKLAQQVGFIPATEDRPLRLPPYHQLDWAGFTTSWCRAKVLEAALQKPEAIIAFETDALFSSEELDLPLNSGLGAWEREIFTSLSYVQSGHYYGTKINKHGKPESVIRCRGIDRGSISRDLVERTMLERPERDRFLRAQLTRFYGAGIALGRNNPDIWCRWVTEDKNLSLFPTGKRVHIMCDECESDNGLTPDVWHTTVCPVSKEGYMSHEFPVAWINPNPEMTELDELRLTEKDYEL